MDPSTLVSTNSWTNFLSDIGLPVNGAIDAYDAVAAEVEAPQGQSQYTTLGQAAAVSAGQPILASTPTTIQGAVAGAASSVADSINSILPSQSTVVTDGIGFIVILVLLLLLAGKLEAL